MKTLCFATGVIAGAALLAGAGSAQGAVELSSLPVRCHDAATVAGRAVSLLPDGHRFELVWNDEFDGTALDASKWSYRTNFWGRPAHWFAKPEDGCVEVKDGLLRLKVKKLSNGQFVSPQLQTGEIMWDVPEGADKKSFWWLGKRMKPLFAHRYGYYECRCRLQKKAGWWSAFWMQTEMQGACLDPGLAGIEQDIMESFDPGLVIPAAFHANGYGPDYLGFHIPSGRDEEPDAPEKYRLAVDTEEFHTYGLLWEPDGYSIYVDGRFRGRNDKAVSHIPEFILLTTECKWYRNDRMTGEGVPELEEAVAANDDFVVDYVRVYDIVDSSVNTFTGRERGDGCEEPRRPPDENLVRVSTDAWEFVDRFSKRRCTVPPADVENAVYGPHVRHRLHLWLPQVKARGAPLIVYFHGGSWTDGFKLDRFMAPAVPMALSNGVAFATVDYRFCQEAQADGSCPPLAGPLGDAAESLLFLRRNADRWNLDVSRIAVAGGSAGGCTSLWLGLSGAGGPVAFIGANFAQTSLDPRQLRAWLPKFTYGPHAFGCRDFSEWLARREALLPEIRRYSPYELVAEAVKRGDLKKVYLHNFAEETPGDLKRNDAHSPFLSRHFKERCDVAGLACERLFGETDVVFSRLIQALNSEAKAWE